MKINLTGRHVDVTEELRDYVHQKTVRLSRFYDRIHDVDVVLDQESEQFAVEMILRADRKHTFVAREAGGDAFSLIDLLVERLERQLVRHKEKNRDHKRDGKGDFTGAG